MKRCCAKKTGDEEVDHVVQPSRDRASMALARKRIDYVLAYHEPADYTNSCEWKQTRREKFMSELVNRGLEISDAITSEYTNRKSLPPFYKPFFVILSLLLVLIGSAVIGCSLVLWILDRNINIKLFPVWAGAPLLIAGVFGFCTLGLGRNKWAYLFILFAGMSMITSTLGAVFTGIDFWNESWSSIKDVVDGGANCTLLNNVCNCSFVNAMPLTVSECHFIPLAMKMLVSNFSLICCGFVVCVLSVIIALLSLQRSWMDGHTIFHHVFVPDHVVKKTSKQMGVQLRELREDLRMRFDDETEPNIARPNSKFGTWRNKKMHAMKEWLLLNDPFRIKNSQLRPSYYTTLPGKNATVSPIYKTDQKNARYPPVLCSSVAAYLMMNVRLEAEDLEETSISRLIEEDTFQAAYPVHEHMREQLQKEWACFRRIFNYQPIHVVKEYLGHKVAFYFAWLGFYITYLIPVALLGLVSFLYGLASSFSSEYTREVCSPDPVESFYMCPLCAKHCSYYLLKDANCIYAKINTYFDNESTPIFAFVVVIWGMLFCFFWKRREAFIAEIWNCRQSKEVLLPFYKMNHLTLKNRVMRWAGIPVMLFFLLLIMVAVVSVIVYRAALFVVLANQDETKPYSRIIVSITASFINLVAINLLRIIYELIARRMSRMENHASKTGYEDSFTMKMFWLQFVNTYSSVVYIAFFKNELFSGYPGKYKNVKLLGYEFDFRWEGCSAHGCFLETTIQIVMLMIGQQLFVNNIFIYWIVPRGSGKKMLPATEDVTDCAEETSEKMETWERECYLPDQTPLDLFYEYQDRVLQFGFVSMFVSAFPLAPLVALISSLIELRADAIKMVSHTWRKRAAAFKSGIGVWRYIITTIVMLSIPMNAFLLAFSSNLVPHTVYKLSVNDERKDLKGFLDFSLSTFNVNDFADDQKPENPLKYLNFTLSKCRFPGFHKPKPPYKLNLMHWRMMSYRLAFALAFSFTVVIIFVILYNLIPDQPRCLRKKIEKERHDSTNPTKRTQLIRANFASCADEDSDVFDDEDEDDGGGGGGREPLLKRNSNNKAAIRTSKQNGRAAPTQPYDGDHAAADFEISGFMNAPPAYAEHGRMSSQSPYDNIHETDSSGGSERIAAATSDYDVEHLPIITDNVGNFSVEMNPAAFPPADQLPPANVRHGTHRSISRDSETSHGCFSQSDVATVAAANSDANGYVNVNMRGRTPDSGRFEMVMNDEADGTSMASGVHEVNMRVGYDEMDVGPHAVVEPPRDVVADTKL